ncbi:MAG: 16S rRNA (guanine(527)-N(7))-methyltransferase RsmG [Peptococcaceae bacterium]
MININDIFREKELIFNENQINNFIKFSHLLLEWNNIMNLTAIEDMEDIYYKHFLDSLLCLKTSLKWSEKSILDIGTGAGFPGIPLKIVLGDHTKLTLLDSLQKRIIFLEHVIEELNLINISCIHGRAEDLARNSEYREKYDIVLARAVAKLPVLLELAIPFLKKGGYFLALKGPEGIEELAESDFVQEELGVIFCSADEFFLKDNEEHKRVILMFRKEQETADKYPRKAGILQKRPLLRK